MRGLLLFAALAAVAAPASAQATSRPPVIAAAASARFALQELAETLERQTELRVRLTFGSSGNLARQIREGAPYELYLSADPRYVTDLAHEGYTRDAGKDYLLGRLAIVVANGSPLEADGSLEDLRAALAAQRVKRFAIANPEHAPYGQGAEQALRHAGLWGALQPHLVLGENVGQTAQFAVSGNTEGGIIAWALAQAPALANRSSAAMIPWEWHTPLRHRAVLLNSAGPVAVRFYDYLASPTARAVFRSHGFALPAGPD